jgi:hypothetical protein
MAVRLSALRAGRPLPPRRLLVLISVRGLVDPRAVVRLEGLGQLKNPVTSSGLIRISQICISDTLIRNLGFIFYFSQLLKHFHMIYFATYRCETLSVTLRE